MNVLIVLAHPELKSFNGALFDMTVKTLRAAGHTVVTSDLYRMGFNPVSGRDNFTSVQDPDFLKLQLEEMHPLKWAVLRLTSKPKSAKWKRLI